MNLISVCVPLLTHQTIFLDSVALVNALHNNPVLASDQPYALEIDGQKVTPVFFRQR